MTAAEPPSGQIFDVLHDVAAIVDRLPPDERKQVMAFLASRQALKSLEEGGWIQSLGTDEEGRATLTLSDEIVFDLHPVSGRSRA